MGVSSPNKYTILPHAQERIMERFNVAAGEQQKWMLRLMQGAELVEKNQPKRREHWKNNNISFIIEPDKQNLVTVWSDDVGSQVKLEKRELNPTVVTAIKETISSVKRKALRHWADESAAKYKEVAELTTQIARTTSTELLESKEERVNTLLAEISVKKSGYEDIVMSANSIL